MTADEVIGRIESAWEELDRLVASTDAGALAAPGPEGWAVKDHLVHIGAWEHWLLALFERRDKLAAMGAAGANKQIDDVNAVVFENHRHDTVPEALAYFHAAHGQLMAVLSKQSTEDFERLYSTFFNAGTEATVPETDVAAQQPVIEAVAGNTYDHYPEHVKWIKELTGSQGRS